ncbi:hypothetical protein CXG81DRAFT_10537 [Caulochytrium protostelioides]|uniref:EF-hand domain-containing protein n=1 Tax=Caulochytrium protostelioides TaxID=1555241 RepID=A0A4P9XBB0_9FUNG|nr:hypothetical protein CXG81DRAFT_10537 [Caulochytrium protostelioides]|eukprot:RKP02662.1 hypothetical protein CXG81DRAFT_10537 [Caulochytrium protostelioides]
MGGPRQPPPGADPQLWQLFCTTDTDANGYLTEQELAYALRNTDHTPFDVATVHAIFRMFATGTCLDFPSFTSLMRYLDQWRQIYHTFSTQGGMTGRELQRALNAFGYNVQDGVIQKLTRRFASPQTGIMNFDGFIQSCLIVKPLSDAFSKLDTNRTGWVNMNYETFLDLVASNLP